MFECPAAEFLSFTTTAPPERPACRLKDLSNAISIVEQAQIRCYLFEGCRGYGVSWTERIIARLTQRIASEARRAQ